MIIGHYHVFNVEPTIFRNLNVINSAEQVGLFATTVGTRRAMKICKRMRPSKIFMIGRLTMKNF